MIQERLKLQTRVGEDVQNVYAKIETKSEQGSQRKLRFVAGEDMKMQ